MNIAHLRQSVLIGWVEGGDKVPAGKLCGALAYHLNCLDWAKLSASGNRYLSSGEPTLADLVEVLAIATKNDTKKAWALIKHVNEAAVEVNSWLNEQFYDIPTADLFKKPEEGNKKPQELNTFYVADILFQLADAANIPMKDAAKIPLPMVWQILRSRRRYLTGEDAAPHAIQLENRNKLSRDINLSERIFTHLIKARKGNAEFKEHFRLMGIDPMDNDSLSPLWPIEKMVSAFLSKLDTADKEIREDLITVIFGKEYNTLLQ